MRITIQTFGSSALESVEVDSATETADVTFVRGAKYTYALRFTGLMPNAEAVADSIAQADSAGKQFNKLVREGILVAM